MFIVVICVVVVIVALSDIIYSDYVAYRENRIVRYGGNSLPF